MSKRFVVASSQHGFAALEALLVVVVIAAIVAAGVYVVKQRHNTTTGVATTGSNLLQVTAKPGTVTRVTQQVEQSAQIDAQASGQNDSAELQAAQSANTAASNLGGAYNESTL